MIKTRFLMTHLPAPLTHNLMELLQNRKERGRGEELGGAELEIRIVIGSIGYNLGFVSE
jgi:hypothetical protein